VSGKGARRKKFLAGRRIMSTITFSSRKGKGGNGINLLLGGRRWGNKREQVNGKGGEAEKISGRSGPRILSTIITFSSRKGRGETAKTFYRFIEGKKMGGISVNR
jgi:hypothetical protein